MKVVLSLALAAFLVLPAAAGIKVDHEAGVDFAAYHTYAWRPGMEAARPQVQGWIVNAVERELKAMVAPEGPQGDPPVDLETVKAFCRAMKPYLKAMAPEKRREMLSLLDFEATVADDGAVKASIAVPSAPTSIHHCTNIGMTTWV